MADAFDLHPHAAIAALPAGRYGVAVSGGADSTALFRLLRARDDCTGVVLHLDHELRGDASDGDARFVEILARAAAWPCVVARRSAIVLDAVPDNAQAKYRAARLRFFARAAAEHALDAVLLAHHADDQAETVLLRLLRGGGLESLAAMRRETILAGVRFLRPLLDVRAASLRTYLTSIGQSWREDASNADPRYRRTIAREVLRQRPKLVAPLCRLASIADAYDRALARQVDPLPPAFAAADLAALPLPLARRAARDWLVARGGADHDAVTAEVCDRLIRQAAGEGPRRQDFPGRLSVVLRGGRVEPINA